MNDKDQIGFQIRQINIMFMRYLELVHCTENDVFPKVTHGWILRYLAEREGMDTYQRDVEKDFKLSRASVTKMLTCLEEEGYISREAVEFDARLKKIVLLEKGLEAHKLVVESIEKIEKNLERGISEDELETFFKVTSKVRDNIAEMEKELRERSTKKNGKDIT
ncbi:MAG: MarR family transcriptional regulator [Lachnospiraceae bacterium]|nr:MarR family transcriptional regulator [Lachnospiraceae bacterium]